MRVAIQGFNQVYTRLQHHHQSGTSDVDLQRNALTEYNATHPTFQYLAEWNYLKGSSKFHVISDWDPSRVRGEPSSKRSKTTSSSVGAQSMGSGSDARIHIDLNESEEEGETRETRETRFYRPGGRDAHKKAAHGSSSNKGLYSDEFEKLGSKLEGLMEVGKQRVDLNKERLDIQKKKLELKKEKQFNKDCKTLAIDTSNLSEGERQVVEEMKRRIREKYGFN
ncbi:hypothetical protein R6Q59_031499 [Mikania micrantha]